MPKKQHLSISICLLFIGQPLSAQIALDGTLGKNNVLSGPNYQIGANLGMQQSGNLFHSFRDFNLRSHETATFSGPANVANIISRVTGGQPSNIDGTIRSTIPNANMYFLNPYGIMFGPHAKLDVQGSFHASTADVLRLDGQATQVHARPSEGPLLVIAPATSFGFLSNTPAPIFTQDSILSVPEGKTLSLIGGELRLTGTTPPKLTEQQRWTDWKSVLSASAGRINLASLASSGEVFLRDAGLELSPSTQAGALTAENTRLSSQRGTGGDIFIRAGQIKLSHTDIETANWTADAKNTGRIEIDGDTLELDASELTTTSQGVGGAGDITLKIAGNLTLLGTRSPTGSSVIASYAQQGQRSGQLNLQAKQVQVQDGSKMVTDTEGTGPGGAIAIQTERLDVTGTASLGQPSQIFTNTRSPETGAGMGGEIKINAETITVDNHGQVATQSEGSGASGNLELNAKTVAVTNQAMVQNRAAGTGASGTLTVTADHLTVSGQIANRTTQQTGRGGDLNVTAKTVTITDPGLIHSSTAGNGNGGAVTVNTDELNMSGRIESHSQNSGVGGHLNITAKTVTLTDSGVIQSHTAGTGAGGTVTLNTDKLTVSGRLESQTQQTGPGGHLNLTAKTVAITDPGVIHSGTTGTGAGGTMTINADELTVSGRMESQSQDSGSGGHLNLTAKTMAITNPGVIHSRTTGAGAGGTVTVNTDQLNVTGRIESQTQQTGTGGNVDLTSSDLAVTDQGVIHSHTAGTGAGGTVTVKTDQLTVTGRIESQSQHLGPGGHLNITSQKTMTVTDPGVIHSRTTGAGAGGTVRVNTNQLKVTGRLESQTQQAGAGGNLELTSPYLTVTSQGLIHTDATGAGAGGTVTVKADQLTLSGQIESQTQQAGAGGNLKVTANTVTMSNPGFIHSRTTGPGAGGSVTVNADQMTMTEGNIKTVTTAAGAGGAIQLKARSLTLLQGSTIETHAEDRGPGGRLSLQTTDSLKLSGVSSNRHPSRIATGSWFQDQVASDAGGGGDLEITAFKLNLSNRGQITAFTHGTGKGGKMTFNVQEKLEIQGTGILDNPQTALSDEYPRTSGIFTRSFYNHPNAGDTGDLTISARDLEIFRGGELATVAGYAGGGNLSISIVDKLLLQDSLLVTFFKGHRSNSGNITIDRPRSLILNNSKIFSEVEIGKAGETHIASDKIAVSSQSSLGATLRLQIEGQTFPGSPDESLCPDALMLPSKPLQAENLIKTPCGLRDNTSSFIITEREGVSEPQDDWLPSGFPRLWNRGRKPGPEAN